MRALLMRIGEQRYAVPLADVRKVATEPSVTELPGAPGALLGIVNLHGTIVPLMDTGVLLGVGTLDTAAWVVVAETERGPVALTVSGLPAIHELGGALGPAEDRRAVGRFETPDGATVLLDVNALVRT